MVKRIASWMAAGVLFALAPEGFSHGGVYVGPADTVPPIDGPGPNTGGPNTGGPNTGKPGGPVTPGGRGPTTPTGGPVVGGGGPPRGPVTTGGRKARGAEDVGGWTFWWEINKDRYLDLRHALARQRASTGSTGILVGMGRSVRGAATNRPSNDVIAKQIVPALRDALKASDADIVDSAALALGRIVETQGGEAALEDLRETLKSRHASARQASILAIGLLGRREAAPALVEILRDSAEGRKLTDGGSANSMERGFAAIALGMIGDATSIPVLIDVAKTTDDSQRDVRSSAISALGLFADDRDDIVMALTELLRDESIVSDIRGMIPIALARLGADAAPAVPQLLKLGSNKRTASEVAQSCMIALGRIASPADAEVVKFLQTTTTDSNDAHLRHFALMAMADLGVKAASNAEDPGTKPVLDQLCKELLQQFTKPEYQVDQPWGAIALGIVARELPDHDEARASMVRVVRDKFEVENDPLRRAACAIGLGLMRSNFDGDAMLDALKDNPPAVLRGYLAVALGMVDHQPAADFLRSQVVVERDDKTRLQLATGLGLLGDTRAVPDLVKALDASKTLAETVSYSRAIGLIGDASAVPALVDLAKDEKRIGIARAFACVALGLLGEKSELYWNTPLSEDANYRLAIRAQQEILDIL